MGLSMCAALVSAGYQVAVTDKRAEAEESAVACGAVWRDTPAQAAAAAGVLITMLPGPREVHAAMLGETGALKGLAAGATWIDMTSNSPAAAGPMQEQAMKQGVEVLEAPVGGGIADAHEGKLQLFAGGSAASTFIRRDMGLVFQGDYMASFGLDRICEELEAVTALAGDYQVPWELSDLVRRTYRRALARYGPVDGELLAVALLEEEA